MTAMSNNIYIEYNFKVLPLQPASDILIAELGEAGFESFVENEDGVLAYIQKDDWVENILESIQILKNEIFNITFQLKEIEQENWNATWEENFNPIQVVLDMGSGTGVLAILTAMKGAKEIDAIDIDNWCYLNAKENVSRNNCEHVEVYEGDSSLLKGQRYDVIIANINRNILLNDIPKYASSLNKNGILFLSGFYVEDIEMISSNMSTREKISEELLLEEETVNQNEIVLFNDEVNTFDHVIDTLIDVCDHMPEQAEQCAMIVHHNGKCTVKTGEYNDLEPSAQELPPIDNFTPIDYAAENQNWGVDQSKEQNIYVANNGGLLEFNGAVWELYGSPNGSAIRSVKAIDNKIYTGCYMEFGYWTKNPLGVLQYTSISNTVNPNLKEDEEFWNILELDHWVLFQSLERIYIYNTVDESVQIIESKSTKAHMFNLNGEIYHHAVGKGLFKIVNGASVLVSDDPIIKSSVISGIFSINRTISNGIYQINSEGEITLQINQEQGLNNNTVLSIFEDLEANLWLALDNGISVINVNSHFNEYIDKNGQLGVVYAAIVYKDYLYLGTNQGLFYKPVDSNNDFTLIANTVGQVWLLKTVEDVLFCGHNKGTFVVDQDKAQLISSFPGTWDIKPIPNKNNLLLQGNFNGLSVLFKENNKWSLRNVIDGFDISSRFFEFVGENQVAVNREYKGIFKLDLDDSYTKVIDAKNEPSKGIGASLAVYENDVLYACIDGIYAFDSSSKQFVTDTLLTNVFYGDADKPLGIFISDEQSSRLWCFTNSNISYVAPGKFSTSAEINKIPIPQYVRKNLGVLGFENLTPIGDQRYLIGISNGYLTLDLNKLSAKQYSVNINSISRKSNNSTLEKIPKDSKTTFKYSQHNLSFSYHVPEYNKYTEVNYQYQLKGIYDSWSEWSSSSDVSFENLPFGNYDFKVRAKIGNDLSTNVASYNFRIERPWYLSNLAIFLYVFGFVMLALLVHRLYKNYYRRQREQLLRDSEKKMKRKKLKAQKKIVQINNEKLKEEVNSKNRELAISTMSIIKKNEFLNAIKDQLKVSADNPQVKAVIKTIDRNINNSDDWKFFEDAFNNADKDFLKKVKNLHPELTSNDLRLCAYLRLNLSSKEIAPLLNISVRSVEVKRYRLRKKMNLPHEDGLADYIMQV
ncbi:Ribosomal protein L11 methyltransferase [Nymphon striatum]|nr:Ribosomal protein L11 methyltransferase [Nymphon striatum]